MPRATLEVADIFRRFGEQFRARHRLPVLLLRVMRAIEICRTAVLGGHVERCTSCEHECISYNSCRNRHCPKCQQAERAEWVDQRKSELLPIEYYHVVFTTPQQLNALALQNKRVFYTLLFEASAQTLLTIAADPKHLGARIGFFSLLHTWGQNLLDHPHVHCVVTGGGLSPDGSRWISCRPGFFLSVRVLSRLFRRLFLEGLARARAEHRLEFHGELKPLEQSLPSLLRQLSDIEWVVYAKPPFGGAAQVIEYLGRYTHRVAIANQRLCDLTGDRVTFEYKDYRSSHRCKSRRMTLEADEFIRRFLLHVLPPGFARIRHYGLLAGRHKKQLLPLCRQLLAAAESCLPSAEEMTRCKAQLLPECRFRCPVCGRGEMVRVMRVAAQTWSPAAADSS